MSLNDIDKRINRLESCSRVGPSSDNGATARLYSKLKQIAERSQGLGLDENSSVAEICAANIDWDNPYDFYRVLRYVVDLRKELKTGEHGLITDEFRTRLSEWLASRGPSNPENTLSP